MSDLTPEQSAALEQLLQITNGADPENERHVLESVNWDVGAAASLLFDAQPGPSSRSTSTREPAPPVEQMEVDDSEQRALPVGGGTHRVGLGLTNYLTLPFSLTFGLAAQLIGFIFRLLRIPFPRLHFPASFTGLLRGSGPSAPRATNESPEQQTDRFIRELEEETGAHQLSRAAADQPGGSSSSSKAREGGAFAGRRVLPDFFVGGYEDALRTAKRDARVLCVVLLSSEHDDVPEFKRDTLTDPEFVSLLNDAEVLVWAGDVRNPDAYQAALKLGVTTYPAVSFIALHPPRTQRNTVGSNSTSGATLHVFSSHAGVDECRAALLSTHVRAVLLPRVTPFLGRIKAEERSRIEERRIRAEQDRAYAEASHRDYERIMASRAAEARQRQEEQEREAKAQAALRREDNIARWRATKRGAIADAKGTGNVRLAVRLPQGSRAMASFSADAPLAALYAFVDQQLVPDNNLPPEAFTGAPDSDFVWEWPFTLAVTYPRALIPLAPVIQPDMASTTIGSVPVLKSGAVLAAELPSSGGSGSDQSDIEDDD